MKAILRTSVATFIAASLLAGCSTNKTKIDVLYDTTAAVRARPTVVYVMDFDLGPSQIKLDPRRAKVASSPVASFVNDVKHSVGLSQTPQEEARTLVELMSKSIVAELDKAGVETRRIAPDAPLPRDGWLVRGSFLQVDEGNRLRRSIGASGQTDIQVAATVYDLALNSNAARLLQLDTHAKNTDAKDANAKSTDAKNTDAKSGDTKSGGANSADANSATAKSGDAIKSLSAIGGLSPTSIAVKYVLAGYDLDRDAKQTGAKIAEEVIKRMRGAGPIAPAGVQAR